MTEHGFRCDAGGQSITDAVVSAAGAIVCADSLPAAERVIGSLSLCCDTFAKSIWPDVAWRFSGLTTDGCPLEFTFSSVDNALRFTVDVAAPEVRNCDRIVAACDLAGRSGYRRPDSNMLERWMQMQRCHNLSWGARLGVRALGSRRAAKFYVEVPVAAQQFIQSSIKPPLSESIAVMVGHEPEYGIAEYYFRQQLLSKVQMDRLLGALCNEDERATMIAGIEHVCGMPIASALEWTGFGYSVALQDGQKFPPRLALFLRSSAIGGACRASQRLLSCTLAEVRERSFYYELFSDLPARLLPDHGVVSISCVRPSVAEMRVGLSGMAVGRLVRSFHGQTKAEEVAQCLAH